MAIAERLQSTLKRYGLFFFLISITIPCFSQPQSDSQNWESKLFKELSKASQLYDAEEADLDLATNLIADVAFYNNRFYQQANLFYFFSLGRSSFDKNPEALKQEARRIMPILGDKKRSEWQDLIKNNDDQLVSEIIRFWDMQDPITTTKYNERLFEHWYRIQYAQKHFTRNTDSPYGTDDRGLIFVKYGWPDVQVDRSMQPNFSELNNNSSGTGFENATKWKVASVFPEFEFFFWQYESPKGKHYYLFGEQYGMGDFGLRKSPAEMLDNMQIERVNPWYEKEYRKLLTNWLLKQLAAYNTDYKTLYRRVKNSNKNIYRYKLKQFAKYENQEDTKDLPPASTGLINDKTKLENTYTVYRLLNEDKSTAFVLALKPNLRKKLDESPVSSTDTLLLNTTLSSYSESQANSRFQSAEKIALHETDFTKMLILQEPSLNPPVYYSMDVIGSSETTSYMPEYVGVDSRIKWITGQQKLIIPEPLLSSGFVVSDLILAESQSESAQKRIPVTPSLDKKFKVGKKMMIFFEAYGVPKSGYKYKYYFEKHRRLFNNKRVDEKPVITIIRDRIDETDQQLFSIDLTKLKPATYDLVIEFTPLANEANSQMIKKRIELTVEK